MAKKQQTIEAVDTRSLAKAKAVRLGGGFGQCIRIVAGGKFEGMPGVKYEKPEAVKQREFRICMVGGAGHAASIQIMTPDIRDRGEPYGVKNRSILVGDRRKMCRFTWPGVHYESDLLPEFAANIDELHGADRRTKARRRRR